MADSSIIKLIRDMRRIVSATQETIGQSRDCLVRAEEALGGMPIDGAARSNPSGLRPNSPGSRS